MIRDVVWVGERLLDEAGELKTGKEWIESERDRWRRKDGKPNDLICGSVSDSGDGGCHMKGG